MESIQGIRKRLKSVRNVGQITKAMELVAATKMRRSQEIAVNSRPYALAALDLLANLSATTEDLPKVLQKPHNESHTLLLLIASDKGLAGAFNASVFKRFERYISENGIQSSENRYKYVPVGEKAAAYLSRKKLTFVEKFVRIGDFTNSRETAPIADFLVAGYLAGQWSRVLVFSTHFRSALRQDVLIRQIFPVEIKNLKETVKEIIPETGKFAHLIKENDVRFGEGVSADYLIEPSPHQVMDSLVRHLVAMEVYHLILEANASEHAARRVAMKNASDNASELTDDLALRYNKSRQAIITRELIEITSGASAASF